jgi:deoxyribose-phosphate aldolase
MDSDDVVRRIASEVLRRLGGEGEPAPPAAASGAGAVSRAAQKPGPGPGLGRVAGGRVLVLLTGGESRLDAVLAQLGRIAEAAEDTRVVLSPSAQRVVGAPAVRRAAPGAALHTEGEVEALLEGVAAVYLPNMSLNALSKIGRLTPDSLVCILAVQALLRGIPVRASRDSLLPAGVAPEQVPAGVRTRLERMLTGLGELGVELRPIEKLAADGAGGAAPAAGAASGSGAAAAAAAPAPSCADGGDCSNCGLCVDRQPAAVRALVDSGADRVGASLGVREPDGGVAGLIDHTLLKPEATEADVRKLCDEARQHEFASVCVNPGWVGLAAELLAGSPVRVCTVIGFPLGATTPTAKAVETRDAIANGATEIDMVINVGALKSGDDELVRRDIEGVVNAARGKAIVKVIIETALLSREEKVKACLLTKMAGADFVKTSTGFASGGATVEDIALMRETVGPDMGVKASGGIKDRATADAMVAAGATRIGASASVAIATGQQGDAKGY